MAAAYYGCVPPEPINMWPILTPYSMWIAVCELLMFSKIVLMFFAIQVVARDWSLSRITAVHLSGLCFIPAVQISGAFSARGIFEVIRLEYLLLLRIREWMSLAWFFTMYIKMEKSHPLTFCHRLNWIKSLCSVAKQSCPAINFAKVLLQFVVCGKLDMYSTYQIEWCSQLWQAIGPI